MITYKYQSIQFKRHLNPVHKPIIPIKPGVSMAPTTYRYVSMAPTTYRYNLSKLVESLTDCSDLHTRPNGFYPTYIQNIVIHVPRWFAEVPLQCVLVEFQSILQLYLLA